MFRASAIIGRLPEFQAPKRPVSGHADRLTAAHLGGPDGRRRSESVSNSVAT